MNVGSLHAGTGSPEIQLNFNFVSAEANVLYGQSVQGDNTEEFSIWCFDLRLRNNRDQNLGHRGEAVQLLCGSDVSVDHPRPAHGRGRSYGWKQRRFRSADRRHECCLEAVPFPGHADNYLSIAANSL